MRARIVCFSLLLVGGLWLSIAFSAAVGCGGTSATTTDDPAESTVTLSGTVSSPTTTSANLASKSFGVKQVSDSGAGAAGLTAQCTTADAKDCGSATIGADGSYSISATVESLRPTGNTDTSFTTTFFLVATNTDGTKDIRALCTVTIADGTTGFSCNANTSSTLAVHSLLKQSGCAIGTSCSFGSADPQCFVNIKEQMLKNANVSTDAGISDDLGAIRELVMGAVAAGELAGHANAGALMDAALHGELTSEALDLVAAAAATATGLSADNLKTKYAIGVSGIDDLEEIFYSQFAGNTGLSPVTEGEASGCSLAKSDANYAAKFAAIYASADIDDLVSMKNAENMGNAIIALLGEYCPEGICNLIALKPAAFLGTIDACDFNMVSCGLVDSSGTLQDVFEHLKTAIDNTSSTTYEELKGFGFGFGRTVRDQGFDAFDTSDDVVRYAHFIDATENPESANWESQYNSYNTGVGSANTATLDTCLANATSDSERQACFGSDFGFDDSDDGQDSMLAAPSPSMPPTKKYMVNNSPTFSWSAVSGASGYEVQISTSPTFATVTTTLTSVTTSATASSLSSGTYYWRVRALTSSSSGSFSRLRKYFIDESGDDFNGDGYGDLLVGAQGIQSAFLFHGSATGGDNTSDCTFTGDADETFGISVAMGDFNGDGFADALIGDAMNGNNAQGKAYIFFGGSGTCNTTADVTFTGVDTAGMLGSAVTSGDVNADGYDDAIVSEPGALIDNVRIYLGAASGMDSTADITISRNSTAVTTGDFNNDSFSDILVGDSFANSNTGQAFIYYGGTSIDTTADVTFTGDTDDELGWSVAVGDFNGDGYDDALIGIESSGTGNGEAWIFLGSASMTSESVSGADVTFSGTSTYDEFGDVVAAGDFDGDSYDDALIGSSQGKGTPAGTNKGSAFIFLGEATLTSSISAANMDNLYSGGTNGNTSGAGLGVVNLDADITDDFAVGSPGFNGNGTDRGMVDVFLGEMGGGLDTIPEWTFVGSTDDSGVGSALSGQH